MYSNLNFTGGVFTTEIIANWNNIDRRFYSNKNANQVVLKYPDPNTKWSVLNSPLVPATKDSNKAYNQNVLKSSAVN